MDNQLKRGMLDALVLSVLIKGDSYGYQIIKDLKPAIDVSESTLYPILKRLETGKFLSCLLYTSVLKKAIPYINVRVAAIVTTEIL